MDEASKLKFAQDIAEYNNKMQDFYTLEEMLDSVSEESIVEISRFILTHFHNNYNQIFSLILYVSSIRHLHWEELLKLFSVINKYHKCDIPILSMRSYYKLFSQCLVHLGVIPDEFGKLYGEKRSLTEIIRYFPEDSFGQIISKDDVEKLIQKTSEIGYEQTMEEEMKEYKMKNPLQFAAKYGAIKCFKFLMNNGYDIKTSFVDGTAVCGGNLEIIRLVAQAGGNFKGCARIAVQWHQYDILQWLRMNYENESKYASIIDCIEFHNYRALSLFLTPDTQFVDLPNNSHLYTASSQDFYYFIKKILLPYSNLDLNIKIQSGSTPLCVASQNKCTKIVKLLLQKGADPNIAGKSGCTPLFFACQNGNLEIAQALIQHGASLTPMNNSNHGMIFAASYSRDPSILKMLAEVMSFACIDGYSALINCCTNNFYENIHVLVDNGVPLYMEDNVTLTSPLIAALQNKSIESMLILVENKADVNLAVDGISPLIAASLSGHIESVRLLIENGADINFVGQHAVTPLTAACSSGKLEIVELLINCGAKMDYDGILIAAIKSANFDIIKLVYNKGCKIEFESNEMIMMALLEKNLPQETQILQFLLDNGFDASNGIFLTQATKLQRYDLANVILDFYKDKGNLFLEEKDIRGQTPIYLSVGDNATLEKLLNLGVNVDNRNENGATALCYAAQIGDFNAAAMLIQKGHADVNVIMNIGATALYVAAQNNNVQIVNLLCENGAKVDLCAERIPTPLYIASKKGFYDISKILIEHGADKNWSNGNNSIIDVTTNPMIRNLLQQNQQ